jgi:hypothetical protein
MKTMSNKAVLRMLSNTGACEDARVWCKEHGGNSAELWHDCERGDWMNWIIVKQAKLFGITKPQLVGALADCAALSLKYYEAKYPDDKRVRNCIKTCHAYAKGKATEEELETAANAADNVAYAAANAADAAAYAAYAAAYAAANAAAYAADAAAYAAAYAAADAAKVKMLKKCANILRKHFPQLMEKG